MFFEFITIWSYYLSNQNSLFLCFFIFGENRLSTSVESIHIKVLQVPRSPRRYGKYTVARAKNVIIRIYREKMFQSIPLSNLNFLQNKGSSLIELSSLSSFALQIRTKSRSVSTFLSIVVRLKYCTNAISTLSVIKLVKFFKIIQMQNYGNPVTCTPAFN